ncbi:MAG: TRAP transporter large permease [Desulfitobacteriaceae bacterium]|nr:TRAP transporter large permease [Desulfitobacteriaceae bacterium]MDD4753794.1 TRAP transporter large permease [Desulfitobacteriaceae bacterium]
MEVAIGVIILVVTLVLGIPIPFAFGATVIWLASSLGFQTDFLLSAGYSQLNSVVLLAIPLFILAGGIMEKGRIGEALIGLVEKFVGRAKGGLGVAAIVASAVFGSISGSASATLSCIGSIMEPRMTKAGYDKGYTAALMAAACPLGLLIPPSSAQILYAWSSNTSVLACFTATVIPGIILVILLSVVNTVLVRKMPIKVAEKQPPQVWIQDTGKRTVKAVPALLMPFIILGGIYGGIMTPTEAAAVSVLYAIPVGIFIYRGLTFRGLLNAIADTSTTTGVVMVMFFLVMIMSRLLVMENVPNQIADALLGVTENKYIILLMINLFMIIIGMLMDDVSGILLCTPILLPIVTGIGIHPVHFAAILGVNLGMGNITPPTAPMLYLSGRVCGAKINKMLSPIMILIIFAWIPTLVLTTFIPELSLTLPKLILPKLFM